MWLSLIIGSCLGSFSCATIERLYQGESILFPASHCTHCHKKLRPYELIPIFSILLQKFCCRYCQKPLSKIYFFAELSGALLFLLLFRISGTDYGLFYGFWFLSGWLLTLTDLFFYHVEPKILYPATAAMLFLTIQNQQILHWEVALFLGLVFLCIHLFLPNSIGGGDLQLLLCWSLFFDYRQLALLLCVASFFGIVTILLSNLRLKPIKKLPFIPFLWAALIFLFLFNYIH